MKNLRKILREAIKLDVEKGDVILTGRFKNKRRIVKTIGTDRFGQPTINGKSILKFKIEKHMPKSKMSAKTREEMNEMKQLRRTIRNLILENQNHYEKIGNLLSGGGQPTVAAVRQAIDLGETLEYLTVESQFVSPAGANAYFEISFIPEFYAAITHHLDSMRQTLDMNLYPGENKIEFIISNQR